MAMLDEEDIIRQIQVQTKVIESLNLLKERILEEHNKHSIAKTVGSSVSIGTAVATVSGVVAAGFTSGLSLGLTMGGIAGTILGTGTTIVTSIVETIKAQEWAAELEKILDEHAKELHRIGEKIVNHPTWKDVTIQAGKGVKYVATSASAALELGRIMKYLSISGKHLGVAEKQFAALTFAVNRLPGHIFLEINESIGQILVSNNVKFASALKIGTRGFAALATGLTVLGIGMDVYTIVDTWANQPGAVNQIDEIVAELKKDNEKLILLIDEIKAESKKSWCSLM